MPLDARTGNRARRETVRPKIHWATLLGLALGCSDEAPATVTLEVYSWWQEDSEQLAFQRVKEIHEQKYENVVVNNRVNDTSELIREEMAGRVLSGAPPATFQANIGADVLRWTMVEVQTNPDDPLAEPEASNWIDDLSALFSRSGLDENLHEGVRSDLVAGSGTAPYAVPINVHRLNVLYYRPDALAEFTGREGNEGRSFLELGTLCPDPDDLDPPSLDLDIVIGGAADPWTLILLTFENVLVAQQGPLFYQNLFRGRRPGVRNAAGESAEVREALKCVQYLSQWFRRDREMGWAQAVNELKTRAAFTVMGDWANGLLAAELESGEVRSTPFPETDDVFVYTSDTFPLPLGTAHASEALDLLETIASPQAQLAFSREKGSIPARRDVDLGSLGDWQQKTYDDFLASRPASDSEPGSSVAPARVIATSGLFPPYYPQGDIAIALREMTANGAGDEELQNALRQFTDAEALFAAWQDRFTRGAAPPVRP